VLYRREFHSDVLAVLADPPRASSASGAAGTANTAGPVGPTEVR